MRLVQLQILSTKSMQKLFISINKKKDIIMTSLVEQVTDLGGFTS